MRLRHIEVFQAVLQGARPAATDLRSDDAARKIESISDGVRTLANSVIPKAVSHLRTLHPDSAIEI
jgi:hypothetical protein